MKDGKAAGLETVRRYVVTIDFREPTFERHTASGPQTRRGTFIVRASNEDDAIRSATYEFRRIEALSGVGWSRDIESVFVFPRVIVGGRR
jgi:hypothetical protein